jgi:hypothetical protein
MILNTETQECAFAPTRLALAARAGAEDCLPPLKYFPGSKHAVKVWSLGQTSRRRRGIIRPLADTETFQLKPR